MVLCGLGPISYFCVHWKVTSLLERVPLWMCFSTVSKRTLESKTFVCAWHSQPGEVWRRVNLHSLTFSLPFLNTQVGILTGQTVGGVMAWPSPSLAPSLSLGQITSCLLLNEPCPFGGLGSALWPLVGVYGLLQRVTGFQKHVLSLHCLKWGAPFLSRFPCEHAPQRMHRESLCMYLLACLQWVVGLSSEESLLPSELSSLAQGFCPNSLFKDYHCIPSALPTLIHEAASIGEQVW